MISIHQDEPLRLSKINIKNEIKKNEVIIIEIDLDKVQINQK